MNKSFSSYSYGHISSLAQQAKGNPVELYYFVVKTTPGLFKVVAPEVCRVVYVNNRQVVFQYKSKTGNWLNTNHYSFKNSAHYFGDINHANTTFKTAVEVAKEHFKNQIKKAQDALNELHQF